MNEFNGTIETTFFGLHKNIQVLITKEFIDQLGIVEIQNDVIFFNISRCTHPDRNEVVIVHSIIMSLICLASFLLQISLFPAFWRLATLRGPAFTILLNLLFCSSIGMLFSVFVYYVEAALGFRLAIYHEYISLIPKDGEGSFYFLFTINRCAALVFPFSYPNMFNRRKVLWMICLAWLYTILFRAESLVASRGFNHFHCMGPGPEGIDDSVMVYDVIMDPSMLELESLAAKSNYIVWYSPMLMDALTVAKLFFDKYKLQSNFPWILKREAGNELVEEGRNERIQLFIICLITTIYHFFWSFMMEGYARVKLPRTYYHYTYILENAMPYLLLLMVSRDVRTHWKRTAMKCFCMENQSRVEPFNSAVMYPTTQL